MDDERDNNRLAAKWLRWMARGIGTLAAGFWLLAGTAAGIAGSDPFSIEAAVLTALIITSSVVVALAWWRERIGGALVLACGAGYSVFAYIASGHNRALAVLITGVPLLIAGGLFLASWRMSRRAEGE